MRGEANGGPAFPAPARPLTNMLGEDVTSGMSLRDYFAARAIPAAVERARSGVPDYEMRLHFGERGGVHQVEIIAALAYSLADAMLAARSTP